MPGPRIPLHTWLDRFPITDPDHAHDLESRAAINEFHHKMPRSEAESKAHSDYVRDRHVEAAAHHLAGMKAAHGAGDMDAARKHSVMYNLHIKALGHDPISPPPQEVVAASKKETPSVYKFKPHKSDAFAIEKE